MPALPRMVLRLVCLVQASVDDYGGCAVRRYGFHHVGAAARFRLRGSRVDYGRPKKPLAKEMPVSKAEYVFLNGEILPWDKGMVHVGAVGFKFGTAVFEGLRGYWNTDDEQLYIFQLEEHMRRLEYSQRFMRFEQTVEPGYVAEKTIELVRANGIKEPVHIMTTVFVSGPGSPTTSGPVDLAITASPGYKPGWVDTGCSAQVSSWQRVPDQAMPMRVKCNANYQNGRIASLQAIADGYNTAILLNGRGKVAEGPSMCFFMLRDGRAVTPPVTSDILESITRRTVMELLTTGGVPVVERDIDHSELYAATEAFFCGTAWEVTPITSIDRMPVGDGKLGPVVRALQEKYFSVVRGETVEHSHWLTPVY